MLCDKCKGEKVIRLSDGECIPCPKCKGKGKLAGPLVEDATVIGGVDKKTGAPVIRPKTPDGKADESTEATDKRENEK
jgi:hypothetical protein